MPDLPLYKAIKEYAERNTARFHMPGHKGVLSQTDVTEVSGTDNLHSPSGPILRSEALCAEAMHARSAFFLVNGSTAGNLAMLFLAGCGNNILLGRNCHKSAINGIALADQHAVPLFPDENGVFTAEAVDEALSGQSCSAVFITSPTYSGAVSDIKSIAEAAHKHGALLLVDAAHGAHFGLSSMLPPIPCHADLWCVSTHKTLCALTQSALLLAGESCPFTDNEIRSASGLFQSTSPSYELMLSIERSVLEPMDWEKHLKRILSLRRELEAMEGVCLLGSDAAFLQDLSRLNISVKGMSGRELADEFEKAGLIPEMADHSSVTLITSPCDRPEWYETLMKTVDRLRKSGCGSKIPSAGLIPESLRGEACCSVRSAVISEHVLVDLVESFGHVCAGAVGCYPPGTTVLFPGERITKPAIEFLLSEAASGAELFGVSDGMIPVMKEEP